MKNLIYILFILVCSAMASVPQSFSWQGQIRNSLGTVVSSEDLSIVFELYQAENLIYSESHQAKTNEQGLVSLSIGTGLTSDDFEQINWSLGDVKLEVYTDFGSGLDLIGSTHFQSVPYALHALSAQNPGPEGPAGPVGERGPEGRGVVQAKVVNGRLILDYSDSTSEDVGMVESTTSLEASGALEINEGKIGLKAGTEGDFLIYHNGNWISKNITLSATGGSQAFSILPPYVGVGYYIALQGVFPSRNMSYEPYIGSIAIFAGGFAPRYWASCDGQLMAINQNTALFSILGTTFGGDGRVTFALPDLRGRVIRGIGQGPGLSPVSWGEVSGRETQILNVNQLPAHSHSIQILPE
jgi:microcystin-dependent protein